MNKKLHISKCNENHILAEDIINDYGAYILRKGTSINEYIIKRLRAYGIEYLMVAEKESHSIIDSNYRIFEKKYENIVGKMKNMARKLIKGERFDYDIVKNMTESIVMEQKHPEHIIKCLGKIREFDDITYYHSINVSFYAMLIGGWLNLARDDIKLLVQAGLLHDLGKIKIPNGLLNKKEKLTLEEFQEIKRHPIYGYEIVRDNDDISEIIKDVILMHHEREDKSGYPLQVSGDDLSMYTKIIAVADVYDAMTSKRPYKDALTPFDAFEEFFIECRGRLNIKVANALLYNLSRYYIGSKALLNTGQTAYIAYIPLQCIWKPIVDTGTELLDLSGEKKVFIECMI